MLHAWGHLYENKDFWLLGGLKHLDVRYQNDKEQNEQTNKQKHQ